PQSLARYGEGGIGAGRACGSQHSEAVYRSGQEARVVKNLFRRVVAGSSTTLPQHDPDAASGPFRGSRTAGSASTHALDLGAVCTRAIAGAMDIMTTAGAGASTDS